MPQVNIRCSLDEIEYLIWQSLREKGLTQCQILRFFLANIDKILKDEDFALYVKLRSKYVKVKQLWRLYLIVRRVIMSIKQHLVELEEKHGWLLSQYPKLRELVGDLWKAVSKFEKELGYKLFEGEEREEGEG